MQQSRARRSYRAGFTIIEVIVIVVILGIIATVVGGRLIQHIGQSKVAVAKSNAEELASAVRRYSIDCGNPEPGSTLDILVTNPGNVPEGSWKGPYVDNAGQLLDPWGHKFDLRVPGEINVDFDIVSYGRDGQPGGEGEDQDVVSGKKIK